MRCLLFLVLVSLLAGCTSMELAQWTSAMDSAAGGGNCRFVDSYGDELFNLDATYDDGSYAGTVIVTSDMICDSIFLDISSSVSNPMNCEIEIGDLSDTIYVPANGDIDDYEMGKSYSSSGNTRINCRPAG